MKKSPLSFKFFCALLGELFFTTAVSANGNNINPYFQYFRVQGSTSQILFPKDQYARLNPSAQNNLTAETQAALLSFERHIRIIPSNIKRANSTQFAIQCLGNSCLVNGLAITEMNTVEARLKSLLVNNEINPILLHEYAHLVFYRNLNPALTRMSENQYGEGYTFIFSAYNELFADAFAVLSTGRIDSMSSIINAPQRHFNNNRNINNNDYYYFQNIKNTISIKMNKYPPGKILGALLNSIKNQSSQLNTNSSPPPPETLRGGLNALLIQELP